MGENQEEANKRLPPSPWTKKEKPRRRNELLGWKTKKRRKSFSLCADPILSIGIAHEWRRLYFTTVHNGRNCTRLALPSKNYTTNVLKVLFAFYWKASCPVAWRRIPSSGSILFSLWFRGERGERSRRKLRTQRTSCLEGRKMLARCQKMQTNGTLTNFLPVFHIRVCLVIQSASIICISFLVNLNTQATFSWFE